MPDRSSSSFPVIRTAGVFAANVLGAGQENICRAFAAKGGDKFRNIPWIASPVTRSPLLLGTVAWFDCRIEQVIEAGDHFIVLAAVLDLASASTSDPLIFFKGQYGGYRPQPAAD
jgi:flavin reductase (DIM6/NTAB) family NADH-FMN oxidoreductase RutF